MSSTLTSDQVLDLLREKRALLEGHFLLSSGLHSDRYFQCALALADPVAAEKLAKSLAAKLPAVPDLVVGPAMGAVVWAHEVARAVGTSSFFTERKDGTFELRRGFAIQPGTKVLVVEDVVTTGGSAKEVIELLRTIGAEVIGVGCVVNRSGTNPFADLGLPLTALAEVTARTWQPNDPPEGFENSKPVKPGSRGA
ncbi:MAG: orotate phosphoribosyltransferase [Planctomycetota bacterium]